MTLLYNRIVELRVGRPGELGRAYTDLRIEFDFDKTRTSKPNTGKIVVYNLNQVSKDILSDKGVKYELRGGYQGLGQSPIVGVLSSGDIVDVETIRRGPDLVTSIKTGESLKNITEKTLDKSYKEGAKAKTIIDDMVDALGVAKGAIKGLKDKVFNSGYSMNGKIAIRLDEMTEQQELEWFVENDELNILPKGGSTDDEAILLTKDTGLLKASKGKSEVKGSANLKDVIRFEALLNPNIKIGRVLNIIEEVQGIFDFVTVRRLKYIGDNKDGKFVAIGEAS